MRLATTMLAFALSLTMASALWAGEKSKAKNRGEGERPVLERIDHMLKNLNLSEAQTAKVEELKKEYGPKFKENFAKMAAVPTAEQKQARDQAAKAAKEAGKSRQEIFKEARAAMKLSAEQKAKLAEIQKQQGALRKELLAKVREVLTPEQREQLKKEMPQRRERKE